MMSRITMNQIDPLANATVVWIDIAAGTNTVRLDNVGLINGGIGVRMDSPSDDPAGVSPGRPLFLLANDLEIDFPLLNAIELSRGEEVQLSNCYVQGSKLRNGIYVAATWNSEIQIVRAVAIALFPNAEPRNFCLYGIYNFLAPAPDSQLMHCPPYAGQLADLRTQSVWNRFRGWRPRTHLEQHDRGQQRWWGGPTQWRARSRRCV